MIGPVDKVTGCLLGLAVGDAVGTTVEFVPPGNFEPVTDMVGGGPFRLRPGEWTDDTSMALCLATSLVECNGFDPADQMQRYVRWRDEGYLSSNGTCFDIGVTIDAALDEFLSTGDPFAGSTDPDTAGNGSLMRLAPVPIHYRRDPAEAIRLAAESSRTTHGAPQSIDACRYFAGLLIGALGGVDKEQLLLPGFTSVDGLWDREPLCGPVAEVATGSFKHKSPPGIRGGGYVVECLEAALWAFHNSDSFEDGCLMAVNLGDDADTTAAVYGQIAGAYYGREGIPDRWLDRLVMREEIEDLAKALAAG
jgi:ADP-ribosylglycohydrolase